MQKALVTGATSGIGLELTERLIEKGVHVIATGRRQQRLDDLTSKFGSSKVTTVPFDLGSVDKIADFALEITKAHPDLDCVVLNAGVQYVMDFSKPHTVDMGKVQYEVAVNYTSIVAMTHATTGAVETIPYPMVINYCATKAATRSFILSAREQLKASSASVRLVELYTPLVQTADVAVITAELHTGQPGWSSDFNPGMPVGHFVTAAMAGFEAGDETVAVGMAKNTWDQFEEARGQRVGPQWEATRKALGTAHTFDSRQSHE
ncbi:MAG: hypothetical protein Q9162_005403 [Coniocarpon cinnabarinum]